MRHSTRQSQRGALPFVWPPFGLFSVILLLAWGGGVWVDGLPQARAEEVPGAKSQPREATLSLGEKRSEELRAELARVWAELWEARQQVPTDWRRVQELQQKAWQLRAELASRLSTAVAPPRGGQGIVPWCPFGLGLGPGPAAGPQARATWGAGPKGFGRGQQGLAPGSPLRQGPQGRLGRGPRGPGFRFIDQNGNGICDYFELGF